MIETVQMQGMKWPDRPYRSHHATRLGEDEHGLWLWAAQGTPVTDAVRDTAVELPCNFLVLVPPGTWWMATWMFGWQDIDLYIDIVVPLRRTHNGLMIVDLDLDVVRLTDGRVELWDEDEFAAHRDEFGYPPEIVASALGTAEELMGLVDAGKDPLGSPPGRWLDQIGA